MAAGIHEAGETAQRIVFEERGSQAGAAGLRHEAAAVVGESVFAAERIADADDAPEFVARDDGFAAERVDGRDGQVQGVERDPAGTAERRGEVGGGARGVVADAPRVPGDGGFDEAAGGVVGVRGFDAGGVGFAHELSGGIVFEGIDAPGAVHGAGDLPGRIVGVAG